MYQEGISIIDELLNELKKQKSSKHDYNILTVLGVDDKEVRICRLIGDLLNPKGAHGLHCEPLKLFLEELKLLEKYKCDLNKAYVVLEDVIDSKRRVDIAIYIGDGVIPIEAKIYAGDQDRQLFDYYNYYKNSGKTIDKIYYLTPLGNEPSKNSRGELNENQYKNISFKETIKNWLDSILKEGVEDVRVKSLIEQFIEVILIMCEKANITEIVGKYIGFDDTDKQKKFEVLYSLFNNSDILLKKLRQEYSKTYLKLGDNYEYTYDDIRPSSLKNDVVFRIINNKTDAKIWLCYEDRGFYIRTEKDNEWTLNADTKWEKENGYYWMRIKNGENAITMDSIPFNEVNISTVLDEIP